MGIRLLLTLAAIALFAAAAATIHVPDFAWNPSWPVRMGFGLTALLLLVAAVYIGRSSARNRQFPFDPPPVNGLP